MKSRATLVLMEQLIMVLVFSLAAALCLGIFVHGQTVSWDAVRQDEAVILAQNAAQVLKAAGDPSAVEDIVDPGGYTLDIREQVSPVPGLRQAEIRVLWEGRELFSLTAGWQEVAE